MGTMTVTAKDGTRLHVAESGESGAPLTVLFVHGWTLDSRTWAHQLTHLPDRVEHPVRALAFDNRGHGRSGPVRHADATVAQVAGDIVDVLTQQAPDGPVVLAGHSLGGMAIMALAAHRPEVLDRVAGIALVATSAGGLAEVTLNLGPRAAALRRLLEGAANKRMLARGESARRLPVPLVRPAVKWLTFGEPAARDDVRVAAAMVAGCSPYTVAAFRASLEAHDQVAALPRLAGRPVLVAGGTRDRLTPLAHSRVLADAIPGAELVVYDEAGHMLPLERGPDLTRRLADLVTSVHPGQRRPSRT
jgi:pimeloyl-ACP methyl ester carboxylesterase